MERTGFILQNECNFKAGGHEVTLLRSAKVSHICKFWSPCKLHGTRLLTHPSPFKPFSASETDLNSG